MKVVLRPLVFMLLTSFVINRASDTDFVMTLQQHKKQLECIVGMKVSNKDSEDLIEKKWFHGISLNLTETEAAKIMAGSIAGYFNAFGRLGITSEEGQLYFAKNSNSSTDNFQKLDSYRTENKVITDFQIYLRQLEITKEIPHNQQREMGWFDCFKLLWRVVR